MECIRSPAAYSAPSIAMQLVISIPANQLLGFRGIEQVLRSKALRVPIAEPDVPTPTMSTFIKRENGMG